MFKEGQESDFVYIVIKGEFLISEKVLEGTKSVIDSLRCFKSCKKVTKSSKKLITVKGSFEVIGSEEAFHPSEVRKYSCECISLVGELYYSHKDA